MAIEDIKKHRKFEKFLHEKFILSPHTYTTAEELKNANLDYDYYISGSDQIWNTSCFDFLSSYYLDFVKAENELPTLPAWDQSLLKRSIRSSIHL